MSVKTLALAILALGFGSPAQAANVEVGPAELLNDLETCWIARASGADFSQCISNRGVFNGAQQSDWINAIWTCAAHDNSLCQPMLAYIKENWGVQAEFGRAYR
jgi:hypothetical protein